MKTSVAKGRCPEKLFHLQFPARQDFLSWAELGCLARALGFPQNLFRQNVNEEVYFDDEGISLLQLNRMVDLKLLHQPLHRTCNLHTSDWNTCVVRKALKYLLMSVFTFEEVHNIRLAYATYEMGDMKGLDLKQKTLLRTLKMCDRVISPMKLMHRIKHMRSSLEEPKRIQLYELFDLILWCDFRENRFNVEELIQQKGKDSGDLYKLDDFETVLSHQDLRQSRDLDQRYLAEEWDFGQERLGSKAMFLGAVVNTDPRVSQAQSQKRKYRRLKQAVSQSQRYVDRVHLGNVVDRPISAPDSSSQKTPCDSSRSGATSVADVYSFVQRRLHSAPSGVSASLVDMSDRPVIPEYVRVQTPSVVTAGDINDVTTKLQSLRFDMVTLESRCQIRLEEEKQFYIPDVTASSKGDYSEDEEATEEESREKNRGEHWTPETPGQSAYPSPHPSPRRDNAYNTRHRGWHTPDHSGRHKTPTPHHPSPSLRATSSSSTSTPLLVKQPAARLGAVTNLHRGDVTRYVTKRNDGEQPSPPPTTTTSQQRPCTAPAPSPRVKEVKRLGGGSRSARALRHRDAPGGRHAGREKVLLEQTTRRKDDRCPELEEGEEKDNTQKDNTEDVSPKDHHPDSVYSGESETQKSKGNADDLKATRENHPEKKKPKDQKDNAKTKNRQIPKKTSKTNAVEDARNNRGRVRNSKGKMNETSAEKRDQKNMLRTPEESRTHVLRNSKGKTNEMSSGNRTQKNVLRTPEDSRTPDCRNTRDSSTKKIHHSDAGGSESPTRGNTPVSKNKKSAESSRTGAKTAAVSCTGDRENEEEDEAPLPVSPPASRASARPKLSKTPDSGGLLGAVRLLESIEEQDLEHLLTDSHLPPPASPFFPEPGTEEPFTSSGTSCIFPPRLHQDSDGSDPKESEAHRKNQNLRNSHKNNVKKGEVGECHGPLDETKTGEITGHADGSVNTKTSTAVKSRSGRPNGKSFNDNSKPPQTLFPLLDSINRFQESAKEPGAPRFIIKMPAKPPPNGIQTSVLRKNSVSGSSVSEDSDSGTPLMPLTSVTVTIKTDQKVSSSTRLLSDHDARSEDTEKISQRDFLTSTPKQMKRYQSSSNRNPAQAANVPRPLSDRCGAEKAKTTTARDRGRIRERHPSVSSCSGSCTSDTTTDRHLDDRSTCVNPDSKTKENKPKSAEKPIHDTDDVFTCVQTLPPRKKSIQFSTDAEVHEDYLPESSARTGDGASVDQLIESVDLDAEAPRRFTFNKVTTRRLLGRVQNVISSELLTRIKTGDTGLKVA